jgi:hypothetical protein
MSTTEHELLDEAVALGVFEAYRAEEYITKNEDGEDVPDKKALHEGVYNAVRRARIRISSERSEKGLTKGRLARQVFPNHPGAQSDDLPELEALVWEQLVRDAWNPTNPNFSGPVQRLIGDRDDKLVLIRAKTTIDGTPGVECVYVTAEEELIFDDFVAPLKASVRRAADRLEKNAAMISVRNKELAGRASREVDSGMKAAAQLAKSTLQLMSGETES